MAAPNKSAGATTFPIDGEHGHRSRNHDEITPSALSNLTLNEPASQLATTTLRRSLDIEEDAPRHSPWITPNWGRRVERAMPALVAGYGRKAVEWTRGPQPPKRHRIIPFFENVQTGPRDLLARMPKSLRICIFSVTCAAWVVVFAFILNFNALPKDIAGFGAPVRLSCASSLWPSPQACGLDGRNCLPFANTSFAFNCPANCRSTELLNPRAIGNVSVNYRPLVVGGANVVDSYVGLYRGDSFICASAIQTGIFANNKGGCGVLTLLGAQSLFKAWNSDDIQSVDFNSTFPMSFAFERSTAVHYASRQCQDPRWKLLTLSTIFTAFLGWCTSSPATFFVPIFTILFFQVVMASDPPSYSAYTSLASTALGRFLPAAFVAAIFYQFSVRKSLRNCKAHLEKTILWVGGAWVGALSNYTFEKIPISRLTGHDIRQQPGAVTALVIIVIILFAVILYQCWCLRLEGRLPRYLALYACLGISLGILAAIPGLNLRIHHYILALLLLPGTAMQTRVSLLCQGLLVGLFVNGIARWGFDSVLQTSAALRGDAQLGSGLPSILEPIINGSSITFAWNSSLQGYDGISVLVNDVERYRGSGGAQAGNFTWDIPEKDSYSGRFYPQYFRFGFVKSLPFGSVSYSDFTWAGTWLGDREWSGIPKGRT